MSRDLHEYHTEKGLLAAVRHLDKRPIPDRLLSDLIDSAPAFTDRELAELLLLGIVLPAEPPSHGAVCHRCLWCGQVRDPDEHECPRCGERGVKTADLAFVDPLWDVP